MPYVVVYLPYLPLAERVEVGPWVVIPAESLVAGKVAAPTVMELANGLVRLYERPGGFSGLGAFAHQAGSRVGDHVGMRSFGLFRRVMMTLVLDCNPSAIEAQEDRDPNESWRTYTSEHAEAWGHPIKEDGWVAEERGVMVPVLAGGYNVLHEDSIRFAYPRELHAPRPMQELDLEYAVALYNCIDSETVEARRLARTIDWLALAWRNGDALDLNLRVAALHTGFETLLDRSANAKAAALALSELLDPSDVEKRQRSAWKKRNGDSVTTEISDLGWWFIQFAQLRNAILHGDEVTTENHHDDRSRAHMWVAEITLRRAIREAVARAGNPDLRQPQRVRMLQRAIEARGLTDDVRTP